MKQIKRLATFMTVIMFISCQSGSEKKVSDQSESPVAKADSVLSATNTMATTAVDPDKSDSIPYSAYGINTYRPEAVALVQSFLAEKYKADLEKNLVDSFSRTFVLFEHDLNEDGKKEIFVGLNGPFFCGSGGCSVLLLSPEGTAITQFTVTNTPIVVSRDRTQNWNDLIINSKGKNYLVKFDGSKYPSNPSVQPPFKMTPGDDLPRMLDWEREPYPWFRF